MTGDELVGVEFAGVKLAGVDLAPGELTCNWLARVELDPVELA